MRDFQELRDNAYELTVEEIAGHAIRLNPGNPELTEITNRYYAGDLDGEDLIASVLYTNWELL